ncbi:hypothetical protein BUE93_09685 [Chromobacterium amazonense]|uniref:Amidohydrolase 3 domain-containing protein n=1 Tax=Chromobacterium amazonense TaxID=1382803 RepID=A0A2S9X5C5_9NEIS|nr:amidohydrolase [Chromobacterium amazonense]PRP70920.1 hypothetical protein BUE93_09685 [Chromobacterium amazonense]
MPQDHTLGCACCGHAPKLGSTQEDNQKMIDAIKLTLRERFPQAPQQAVIFHGGTIHTMEAPASRTVEALGIANGVIVATGSFEEVKRKMADAGHDANERPLDGRTLMPGLIDSHMHMLGSALNKAWNNVSAFRHGEDTDADSSSSQTLNLDYSLKVLEEWIKAAQNDPDKYLLKDKDGETSWFIGYGVDPSLMTPWGNINLEWLEGSGWESGSGYEKNKHGQTLAILLINASGHLAYANSAAIKRFESDPNTEKLMASALKTGILTELQVSSAMHFVGTCTSTQQKLPQGIADVLQNAVARGITTLFDPSMGVNDKEMELEALRQVAHLGPLRLAGGLFVHTQDDLSYWLENHKPDLDNHLDQRFSIKGIKIISDGSNQGLTGLQRHPYLCAADHPVPNVPTNGKYNYKPKSDLESLVLRALCQGWPTLVHANGDKAIKRVLNAYGKALNPFPHEASSEPAQRRRALRSRLEHASLLDDEDIGRMASMGLSPSFLIGHVGYWGYVFQGTIFGANKAQLLDRCRSALDQCQHISLHSDHFVSPLGPLRMAEQAIYRKMEAAPGSEKPVLNANEVLNHEQALRAVTLDAAWHCHLDHLVGSLEPGKLADLVILKDDPLDKSRENLRDIIVHETWLAGARSYANPATH